MHHKHIINHHAVSYSRTAPFPYELRCKAGPGDNERRARWKQGRISSISTENYLQFFSHFSSLFQLACAQCRAALKPMGCSLVPFPKAYHGSLLMAETGLDLFCGFMGSLTFSPFMGVWLPQAFHCSTKRLFFSLSQKWYSRYKRYSKSLKQLHFPSCDYSMTKQGIEEVISDIQ